MATGMGAAGEMTVLQRLLVGRQTDAFLFRLGPSEG